MSLKIFQIVPNTIPRLVQVSNNQLYDGNGNLIPNPVGPQGKQGLSFSWMGTYATSSTYSYYNVVEYDGSSYIYLGQPASGVTPSTTTQSWAILASRGFQGVQGPQGFRGFQGFQGVQGFRGFQGVQGLTGLGLFTFVNSTSNYSLTNNSIKRVASSGYDVVTSLESYPTAYLTGTILSSVPGNYSEFYLKNGTNTFGVYTSNMNLYYNLNGSTGYLGGYSANDIFTIEISLSGVKIYQNGTLLLTDSYISGNYYFSIIASQIGEGFENISFSYLHTGSQGFQGPTGPSLPFYYQTDAPTYSSLTAGSRWYDSDTGIEYIYVDDGLTTMWVEPINSKLNHYTWGITVSSYTISLYSPYGSEYFGISSSNTSYVNLPTNVLVGKTITIKDESGKASIRPIYITPYPGELIDNQSQLQLAINYGSLTMLRRNNNWWII